MPPGFQKLLNRKYSAKESSKDEFGNRLDGIQKEKKSKLSLRNEKTTWQEKKKCPNLDRIQAQFGKISKDGWSKAGHLLNLLMKEIFILNQQTWHES